MRLRKAFLIIDFVPKGVFARTRAAQFVNKSLVALKNAAVRDCHISSIAGGEVTGSMTIAFGSVLLKVESVKVV